MSNSKMSARERIEYLLDTDSFVEIGNLVQARNTDYNLGAKKVQGDGVITGYGVLNDRMVYVYSQDVAALGGSVGEMHAKKIANIYDMAMKMGVPVVGMLDCAGLRLQEANDALQAFGTIFRKQAKASGKIPQICAVFGNCGGGSALMASMSDFVLMEKENGALFINSPNALEGNIESKLDTSSYEYQANRAGNVDFVCDTEEALLDQVRILVDVLPSDFEAEDACFECEDDLNRIIPELAEAQYDAKFILRSISDNHLFIETKEMYAEDMVTAFIRLNGETVGAIANQTVDGEHLLTTRGLDKAVKFIKFCDAFSLPILTITNVSGIKASQHEERKIAKALAQFTVELAGSTVPKVNLIAGEAFGTAAVVMNSKAIGADFVLAWPDASVGMMDAEQAVRIMYAEEITAGEDQLAVIAEKTEEYRELQSSAMAAAKRGYVDDIIEPDATRKRLIAAFEMLYGKKQFRDEKKHSAI
ncbi:MAG: carboxyl transferase domain-containing protein [Lachnospiraceae bacterium]|nr:carboxyl transferase domain-containing protein [Lachnospiraceae bacterium]